MKASAGSDLAILTAAMDTNDLSADIAPAKRDGEVDTKDRELLMEYLGTEVPEFNLIAHWKLDESEGDVAACTTKADGALHGGPVWQPGGGKVGGALQLDGVDDYISTKYVLDPSFRPFSVFAWVKGGVAGQVVLSQQNGANWLMANVADGTLTTELKGPGRTAKSLKSTVSIAGGEWCRVGLVYDGTNRILYVDGVEVANDTHSGLPESTGGMHIGAGSKLAAGTFWSGLIDDVRIYDRAVKP